MPGDTRPIPLPRAAFAGGRRDLAIDATEVGMQEIADLGVGVFERVEIGAQFADELVGIADAAAPRRHRWHGRGRWAYCLED